MTKKHLFGAHKLRTDISGDLLKLYTHRAETEYTEHAITHE